MRTELASYRGVCRWLAVLPLAMTAQTGRCLPTTEASAAHNAHTALIAALKALEGRTLTPVWSDTGKRAESSHVSIRLARHGSPAAQHIIIETLLRSMPSTMTGPDDDKRGANPDEVKLSSVEVYAGYRLIKEISRFDHWYDPDDSEAAEMERVGAMREDCGGLYTEATRQYRLGDPAPAFFESRCVVRIPVAVLDSLTKAAASGKRTKSESLTIRLITHAGVLVVSLTGEGQPGFGSPKTAEPARATVGAPADTDDDSEDVWSMLVSW